MSSTNWIEGIICPLTVVWAYLVALWHWHPYCSRVLSSPQLYWPMECFRDILKKNFPVGTFYCGQRNMIRAFLLWAMIKTIFASVPWQRFLRQRAWCMYLLVHIFINCQVSFSFFAEWLLMLVVLSSVWLCIFLLMFTCYLWDPGGFKTKTTRKLAWECFCVHPAVAVFPLAVFPLAFWKQFCSCSLILLRYCRHCC